MRGAANAELTWHSGSIHIRAHAIIQLEQLALDSSGQVSGLRVYKWIIRKPTAEEKR